MDILLRDSLRARIKDAPAGPKLFCRVTRSGERVCQCHDFLDDVAYGHRKLETWDQCCSDSLGIKGHDCVCFFEQAAPIFGSLVSGCRADKHGCICLEIVVPDEQLQARYQFGGFMMGHLACRSEIHHCICKSVPDLAVCRASQKHNCMCHRGVDTCRRDEAFLLHECQCATLDHHDVQPCRIHRQVTTRVHDPWKHY